ncbi:NADH:ubiquinone reductase (Na(+)-transporting) subunit D [candidate division KSB3 bacterium]|jgi:Na(+)-translocating NADH:ubiquinone oxidoreductase D subunit|uniref:NADH:ubiquinone reductase (Na(+)-transporting) subunit D n=1 Tax=candidate division KSB3 bacterium TaxID=2044937 RepID=A0A9D5JSQ6_9BACT|nr:NADH:ubiquinone reductase (Na(+)-transporting) subunit D [candidate division KSB3 bacterium]MBD3323559.1 NADH:ubiquinone reductase (Na(+)-transporting) subunit D [candidate division KSB3 bacterium]
MAESKGIESKSLTTIKEGIWRDHPIFSMLLGICSALAVSNRVANAVAMSVGVTFVLVATAILISLLRNFIPQRIRMITYMLTIASFVIIVDKVLKAYFPVISESIGPYVGLIITNCIIMGRCEAFYIQNTIGQSVLDALANGFGYAYTLIIIAIVREFLGFGTIFNIALIPDDWTRWVVMAMAPGAFFVLSIFIWITRTLAKKEL